MECTPNKTYICEICTKKYSSRQNLWKHNYKFHKSVVKEMSKDVKDLSKKSDILLKDVKDLSKKSIKLEKTTKNNCVKCKKEFNSRQAKWYHEQKCEVNNDIKLKEEIELLKKQHTEEINELRQMILQLMNAKAKTHHKTLKKINNQLNTGNINSNNTINNYNIITLGNENLPELLSRNEKLDILNHRYMALEHIVAYKHFNEKFPQFKNIMITNTQNNIAYKYDKISNNFIATDKNELVTDVVNSCMEDIETLYDELEPDLLKKTKEIIEKVIYKMKHDSEYKDTKKKDIKLVIYNNKDKVTKEIVHTIEIDM